MKIEGIAKISPVILLDATAISNVTDKTKKKANQQIYKRLQVLKASGTKIAKASEELKQDINKYEAKLAETNTNIQKYLDLIKKRV
jgi:uncharacterized protein YlxW (UPF0749 family)